MLSLLSVVVTGTDGCLAAFEANVKFFVSLDFLYGVEFEFDISAGIGVDERESCRQT